MKTNFFVSLFVIGIFLFSSCKTFSEKSVKSSNENIVEAEAHPDPLETSNNEDENESFFDNSNENYSENDSDSIETNEENPSPFDGNDNYEEPSFNNEDEEIE
jgi:hypothetical protein